MDPTTLSPTITTHHTHIPSPLPTAPSFVFHLTHLKDTLFVWVGTGAPTASGAGAGGGAGGGLAGTGLEGMDEGEGMGGVGEKRLAAEWGVSMPTRGNMPVTSTPIFRSGSTDIAVPMSQRLARKFPAHQVHLSLSLPPALTVQTGPSLDPLSSRTLLVMEKELGKWLGQTLEQVRA